MRVLTGPAGTSASPYYDTKSPKQYRPVAAVKVRCRIQEGWWPECREGNDHCPHQARWLRVEGGARTLAHVSARPFSVLSDISGALHGRHSSVSAPPCRSAAAHGVRGALYALRTARARDRHTCQATAAIMPAILV